VLNVFDHVFMMVVTGVHLGDNGMPVAKPNPVPDPQDRPVNAYFLFSEAHVNLRKGNLDGAIENMQQALILDPGSVYLKRELAGFWLMKKDTTAALAASGRDFDQPSRRLIPYFAWVGFNQNINQPKAAMDAYSRVIALDPGQQNIYLQLGGMYMEQEQWPQAKQVYEQLVKNFPGAYAGYFFLGRISAINGDRKSARAYFEKTLALEPELVESRFELGALYEADKKYKKAASVYSDILEQDPNNIQAQMALGHAYYQQGMKKKAQSDIHFIGPHECGRSIDRPDLGERLP
jgi:tetratricopeptide (TPR) repeat protein